MQGRVKPIHSPVGNSSNAMPFMPVKQNRIAIEIVSQLKAAIAGMGEAGAHKH